MKVLITGAAGNLGSHLARHLIEANRMAESPIHLRLLIHKHEPPADIVQAPDVTIHRADLAEPETLAVPVRGADCIIHFAGILFAPRPEKFLPETNTLYVRNIVDAANEAGVKKFIIVSFPHVEGETTPDHPAKGVMPDGEPDSVHARTRLAAERYLFSACEATQMTPVALRPGMIYGQDILMIDAARWLSRRGLLAVWRKPTWIHLLSLPDFLAACQAAIEKPEASGIYNLGDEQPLTLQEFLDRASRKWGITPGFGRHTPRRILSRFLRGGGGREARPWWEGAPPWRAPGWAFYGAAALTEIFAAVFRTRAPLTRDFIRIGMASYVMDTSRMKAELLSELKYPTLNEGIGLL